MKPGFFISKSRRKRLTYDEKISMLKNHVSMETILQSRSSFDYYLHKVKSQQMERHVQRLHNLHRRQGSRLMGLTTIGHKSLNGNKEMLGSRDPSSVRGPRKQCTRHIDDNSAMSSVDVSRLTIHDKTPQVKNNRSSDEIQLQTLGSNFSEEDNFVMRFSKSDHLKPEHSERQETQIGEVPKTIRKRKSYFPRKYQSSNAIGDVIPEKNPVLTTSPDLQPFLKKSRRLVKLETSRGCQTCISGQPQKSTINTWSLYNSFQEFMKSKNRSKGIFTVSEFTGTRDVRKGSGSGNTEDTNYQNGRNYGHFSVTRVDSEVPDMLNDSNNKCNDKGCKAVPTSSQNYWITDSQHANDRQSGGLKESSGKLDNSAEASSPSVLQSDKQHSTKPRKVDMYLYLPPKCFNQPDLITVVKLPQTDRKLV